jgi:hypothetical protein
MITRVRITHADQTVQISDLAWSQLCELLRQVSREHFRAFWRKHSIALPDGGNVQLIKEGI